MPEQRNRFTLSLSVRDEAKPDEILGIEIREGDVSVDDTFDLEAGLMALGQDRFQKKMAKMAAARAAAKAATTPT